MSTTYEDILQLFREVAEAQKETERKFQETERLLKERSQDTDRKFQETDQKIKSMATAIHKLGDRLGDYIEDAVRPAAVRLFQERGIAVHEVHQNVSAQRGIEGIEVDLLVVNDTDVIAIECKSLLSVDDVNEHRERLDKLKRLLPTYANKRVLGAVSAMVIPDNVAQYAYRQGFYVIGQSGEQLVIRNDERFQPKAW
ncbi:MAG: DUF3782 domain-containing protein [Candidatus Competibacteraceae bacterium]|nr:DUF3782 domain-containing protein [Candidatus Competibacteraceae bacterium]MCP5125745.1 DUF3782 domain-containing protein [Gammaproteobacteria bacterium]